MKAKFSIVSVIVEKAAIFGKKSMSCVVTPLADKFADVKVKGQCSDTLMSIAERMTLNYTSLQVMYWTQPGGSEARPGSRACTGPSAKGSDIYYT